MGRPSKYNPDMNEQVYKLCLLGYTDKQIAEFFGVAESTINKWKIDEPEFLESLKRGKDVADCDIVESLYQKAKKGDVTAMIFWLKNRQPEHWRDKQEIDQTNKNHHTVEYKNVSKDPKYKEK